MIFAVRGPAFSHAGEDGVATWLKVKGAISSSHQDRSCRGRPKGLPWATEGVGEGGRFVAKSLTKNGLCSTIMLLILVRRRSGEENMLEPNEQAMMDKG